MCKVPGLSRASRGGSNSSNNRSMERKQVRISNECPEVLEIPHLSGFSKRHLNTCWYTQDDFSRIAAENNTFLKYMMIGGEGIKHVETSDSTTRGLEAKTLEGAEQKKIATLDGLCAVLLEQERQKQKGIINEERIREAYLAYTQVPAMAALKQGRVDARYEVSSCSSNNKKFREFDDFGSTDTTLVSDVSSDSFMLSADGSVKSSTKSIVRRLLTGRPFRKNRKKQAAGVATSSSSLPATSHT